jgi:hypothetical protein
MEDIDDALQELNQFQPINSVLLCLYANASLATCEKRMPPDVIIRLASDSLQIDLERTRKDQKSCSIDKEKIQMDANIQAGIAACYQISCVRTKLPNEFYEITVSSIVRKLEQLITNVGFGEIAQDLRLINQLLNTLMNLYGPEHSYTSKIDLQVCQFIELYYNITKITSSDLLETEIIFLGALINILKKNKCLAEILQQEYLDHPESGFSTLCDIYSNTLTKFQESNDNIICAYSSILLGLVISNNHCLKEKALCYLNWNDFGVMRGFIDDFLVFQQKAGHEIDEEMHIIINGLACNKP